MPLVPGDSRIFNSVYENTRRSVVGLMIDQVQVGSGIIVYKSSELTVVALPSSCTRDLETKAIHVSFFDGTRADSTDVVQLDNGGMALLFVGVRGGEWQETRMGRLGQGESEIVLTIVPLVSYYSHRQRTYTSYIISPSCTYVNIAGSKIHETSQLFSFSLPVGNYVANPDNHDIGWVPVDNSVLGAPIFNMNNEYVGYPLKRALTSHDMKIAIRGEVFQHNLNIWLDGRQWEDVIQPYVQGNADLTAAFDWYK